jgi:hypothetical protein
MGLWEDGGPDDWDGPGEEDDPLMVPEIVVTPQSDFEKFLHRLAGYFSSGDGDYEEDPYEKYEVGTWQAMFYGDSNTDANPYLPSKDAVYIPDKIGFSINIAAVLGVGVSLSYELAIITKGPNAGLHGFMTTSTRVGFEFGTTVSANAMWKIRDRADITSNSLLGKAVDLPFANFSLNDNNKPTWVGPAVNAGPIIGYSAGLGETIELFLKDFRIPDDY